MKFLNGLDALGEFKLCLMLSSMRIKPDEMLGGLSMNLRCIFKTSHSHTGIKLAHN